LVTVVRTGAGLNRLRAVGGEGAVAEWLKALAWKASYRSKAGTRVRIPLAP
jgi:hypothetical protein